MEFKGTKGNWFIKRYGNVVSENQEVAYMPSLNSKEIKDANASLISKAPEMLEMLNRILQINFNDEIQKEIKQLINMK